MSNEEIEKFEHAYNYWITDRLDDGTFSVLVYNFIHKVKPLITEIADFKSRLEISEQQKILNYNCLKDANDEINILKDEQSLLTKELPKEYCKGFEKATLKFKEINNDLQSRINELKTANKWISVKDAFPNDNVEVNVRVNYEHNGNGIIEPKHTAKYNHTTKYWEAGLSTLYFVTHWMPLQNKDAI